MLMLTLLSSWMKRRSVRARARSAWDKAVLRNARPLLEELEYRLVPTVHYNLPLLAPTILTADLANHSSSTLVTPTPTGSVPQTAVSTTNTTNSGGRHRARYPAARASWLRHRRTRHGRRHYRRRHGGWLWIAIRFDGVDQPD